MCLFVPISVRHVWYCLLKIFAKVDEGKDKPNDTKFKKNKNCGFNNFSFKDNGYRCTRQTGPRFVCWYLLIFLKISQNCCYSIKVFYSLHYVFSVELSVFRLSKNYPNNVKWKQAVCENISINLCPSCISSPSQSLINLFAALYCTYILFL